MSENLTNIKIYHIIHIDRLESILSDGFLYCDDKISKMQNTGTVIGMQNIKERRLSTELSSISNLTVGQCVPFYFCPRSVMLYVIKCQNNPDLKYSNGQNDIIHLVFDLKKVLDWANDNHLKTCYTTSNAGSKYFEDYSDFSEIKERVDWQSVNAIHWSGIGIDKSVKENKQAEFLIESKISINLLELIGVYNLQNYKKVNTILKERGFSLNVMQKPNWYY